jgi:hypothetical protein
LFCLQINSYNPRKILLHPMEKLCSVVSPWTRKRTNSLKTFCERMYSSFTSELCDYWCDSICSNPSSATGENFPILVVSCSHGQPASQTISGINTLRAYQTFYFSASLNASRGSCIYFPSAKNSFELADPVFPPPKTTSFRPVKSKYMTLYSRFKGQKNTKYVRHAPTRLSSYSKRHPRQATKGRLPVLDLGLGSKVRFRELWIKFFRI